MFLFTPIGIVPSDYLCLDELCQKACIRKRKEYVTLKDGTKKENITWSIVAGERDSKTDVSGHVNFCILLDYIDYRVDAYKELCGEKVSLMLTDKLNVALGKTDSIKFPNGEMRFDRKKMQETNALRKEMRAAGNSKYSAISAQSKKTYSVNREEGEDNSEKENFTRLSDALPDL